jgi:hypothetical protein
MSIEVNGYLLRERVNVGNFAAGGVIGTAAATVDIISDIGVAQTTVGQTLTLPAPTDPRNGRSVSVANAGTVPFLLNGISIGPGSFSAFEWHGTTWRTHVGLAGSDFWRTDPSGQVPDGVADSSEPIVRTGQTKIDTATAGDSGFTLDDLRSRNSVQHTSGDAGVTDTNMTAIGVDLNGKVRLSNALSVPDIRATNPNPQDYAAGFSNVFKQSATIGLTGTGFAAIPVYVNLETTRRHAKGTDFSGGPVIQRVFLEDGREYYRTSATGTTWNPWILKTGGRAALQHRWTSQANTKISIAGEIRWAGFYQVMTNGTNPAEPGGHFRIDMPADAFAVPVAGGGTRAVVPAVAGSAVDTGGILLNNGESLYYRHVYGTGQASVPANFLIVPYTAGTTNSGPYTNSDEWIKIASKGDNQVYQLGNGDTLGLGAQIGSGTGVTIANWTAMKQRVMGSGYFFSPGGNTSTPTAFGFTGTIRWIDGGSTVNVNSAGYRDVSNRTVGQVVRGVNGAANRAWRLMTAAEKPEWFGGMQRGNDPITAASTTVVNINDNETLYFVPNLESGTGTEGQWVVAGYSGVVTTPVHWLPVASRQTTGGQGTIQVLLGGVQYALKAGDARYTSTNDATIDAVRRNGTIQLNAPAYCRFTTAAFFAGAAANGLLGGSSGVMVSWPTSSLMYGISDGYANFGNLYSWINPPAAGAAIPVVCTNSNVTRVVTNIGGRAYVPLGLWEALYFIPPANVGGYTSNNGDWVISYYGTGNQHVPPSAVLIAKVFSGPAGSGNGKTRVKFADGSYIQPGLSLATTTVAENDHAQGSGDWRAVVAAGQTGPGMTAALPAIAGISNGSAVYNIRVEMSDPRPTVVLDGGINITAAVPDSTIIGFLPGVKTRSSGQITGVTIRHAGNNTVPSTGFVTFENNTSGGQNGTFIRLYGASAGNVAAQNGGAHGGGGYVSLAGLHFHHA